MYNKFIIINTLSHIFNNLTDILLYTEHIPTSQSRNLHSSNPAPDNVSPGLNSMRTHTEGKHFFRYPNLGIGDPVSVGG